MGDVSKKTLAVLFIIAIVLSAVATWKMLSTPTTVIVAGDSSTVGQSHVSVGVGIEDTSAKTVESDGKISFEVEK